MAECNEGLVMDEKKNPPPAGFEFETGPLAQQVGG